MSPYHKVIHTGAVLSLLGFFLSGPVAVVTVMLYKPQPQWVSASVFVEHYHPVQNLPYFFGFALLSGMLLMTTGHFLASRQSPDKTRIYTTLALLAVIIFSTLIAFNYICQTTFVHNLARHYRPEYEALIAGFSMSNPASLAWAIEMWGYAFLGIGTWLLTPYYAGKSFALSTLLMGNGVISLISPVLTIIDQGWVASPLGLGLFMFWNIWMIVLVSFILRINRHI